MDFNEIFNNCPKIQEGDSKQRRENGKAIHVSALQKFKEEGYTIEYPIEYSPKETKHPITLRGRIDAINFDKQEIIDIKTTTQSIEKLDKNPYILQVGTYTKILELLTEKQFSAYILIKNTTLHVISLTREQIESAYKEMITRAIFASILSKHKKQDISGLSQSIWNRENRLRMKRQYYTKHREQHNAYSRKWQSTHPEKQKEYCRKWRTKHREQQHAYYIQHREQKLAYMRVYCAKHREQINACKRALYARKKAQQNLSSSLDQYT